jgi:hypothetical protein
VREVGILKKDPDVIKEQIEKLDLMSKFLSTNYLKIYHLITCCSAIY